MSSLTSAVLFKLEYTHTVLFKIKTVTGIHTLYYLLFLHYIKPVPPYLFHLYSIYFPIICDWCDIVKNITVNNDQKEIALFHGFTFTSELTDTTTVWWYYMLYEPETEPALIWNLAMKCKCWQKAILTVWEAHICWN